jgi:hypothetical protein
VPIVVALEPDRGIQHGLLEQSALGAELVRANGFVLQAERNIEDGDILDARAPAG